MSFRQCGVVSCSSLVYAGPRLAVVRPLLSGSQLCVLATEGIPMSDEITLSISCTFCR